MTTNIGTLYIVATPLGNLKDMTQRAIETLQLVDLIAVEDTRHSASLLQQFGISTPTTALHEHNERERAASLIDRLQQGQSIALISDAGTPLISDPGYFLVREAHAAGIRVVPIPGPSALIAALSASGMPTDRFIFEGFLPAKTTACLKRLMDLQKETRTMVFYEAPHRILSLLENMEKAFGSDRRMTIARELTKMFETIRSGKIGELVEWTRNDSNQQRGEFVVLVEGNLTPPSDDAAAERILTILLESLSVKQAVEIASKMTGERKNSLYEVALKLQK